MRIGVDLMGGESSPYDLLSAVLIAAREFDPSDEIRVFAAPAIVQEIQRLLLDEKGGARISAVSVSEVIEMDEAPLTAVRRKKDASMVVGVRAVKEKQIDALVSVGNTGALMASAIMALSPLPGIDRPALLAVLPTDRGNVAVLDVGGNVAVKAENLVQFAKMGAAYQQCCSGIATPKVGLLNIGVESLKGTSEVRQAYLLLQKNYSSLEQNPNMPLHFVGNVEGREVFQGKVDVLVTDGFTGNVFLKTAEGVSAFLLDQVQKKLSGHKEMIRMITELGDHVDFEEYPGAILCGVDGIIVKCHGHSSARGMLNGIRGTAALIRHQLLSRIKDLL